MFKEKQNCGNAIANRRENNTWFQAIKIMDMQTGLACEEYVSLSAVL